MNQLASKNRHYIPEWLLWKFREPVLFELDIFTGKATQRNPEKAGSEKDLWPEDIEDGLTQHDTLAARIYRNKIVGKSRIVLSGSERFGFAHWLAQFLPRIPATRNNFQRMLEEEKREPQLSLLGVPKRRVEILKFFRDQNPERYDQLVEEVGKAETEEYLLGPALKQMLRAKNFRWPTHEKLHQDYMRSNSSHGFAKRLCGFDWNWLRSKCPFVIGDNPLVRWDVRRGRWNYGIGKEGIEITMPLGLNLCLRLRQGPKIECEHLLICDEELTREYNCRQRLAAVKYVYGNSPDVLDFINNPVIGWQPEADDEPED